MTLDDHDALSALLDGEPVDPQDLLAALEQPDALDALRGFVRLRLAMTVDDQALGSADPCPTTCHPLGGRPVRRRWILVGAITGATLLLGAVLVPVLPRHDSHVPQAAASPPETMRPPTASRVLAFELGTEWKEIAP